MRKEYAARLRALCECAVFLSCAMVLSYIESLFPLPIPLPGIKLGLANAAVLTLLLCRPAGYALAVSLARGFERAAFGQSERVCDVLCRGGVLLCSILYIKAGRGIRRAGYIGWRRGGA